MDQVWNEEFIIYDDGYYIGQKRSEGKRGFKINENGDWSTSFFVNEKVQYATIDGNMVAYYYKNDKDYFEIFLDEETNSIDGYVSYSEIIINFTINFNNGNWKVINENNRRKVTFNSDESAIFYYGPNSADMITRVSPFLAVRSKVKNKRRIGIPDKLFHRVANDYEFIRSKDKYDEYRSVMMLINKKGDKWFGESLNNKPRDFGVATANYSNFTSFCYGMFEPLEGGVPYLFQRGIVAIKFFLGKTSSDNSSITISDTGNPNKGFTIYLKNTGPKFSCYDNDDGSAVFVHEDFSSVDVRHDDKPLVNYQLR